MQECFSLYFHSLFSLSQFICRDVLLSPPCCCRKLANFYFCYFFAAFCARAPCYFDSTTPLFICAHMRIWNLNILIGQVKVEIHRRIFSHILPQVHIFLRLKYLFKSVMLQIHGFPNHILSIDLAGLTTQKGWFAILTTVAHILSMSVTPFKCEEARCPPTIFQNLINSNDLF